MTKRLGRWLAKDGHSPLMVSTDVNRPAAREQLLTLGKQAGVPVHHPAELQQPRAILDSALAFARSLGHDVLLVDTAGRLHVDDELMAELQELKQAAEPSEVLFVADAMTGQDAVRSASEFEKRVGITGILLSKLDGDARGGAALSLRQVTGKPILFLGVGEKLDGLEVFSAERLAGRILGMGDVVGLVERAQAAVSQADAERLAARMRKSEFTLEDFLEQMRSVRKMGSLEDIVKMLPGLPKGAMEQLAPQKDKVKRYEAILLSMTLKERRLPRLIDGSRRRRIAAGSGTSVPEVNRLLKDFEQTRMMMKALKKGPRGLAGLRGRMR